MVFLPSSFFQFQLVYSADKSILTVSNKPSLHSNDFVRTIAPFSFKFNKNSVPPPTKPNGLLVANRNTIIIIIMIGLL